MNSEMRNTAFQHLIEKCKEIYPGADLAYVKKKIESLRNSYRRELRKIRKSTRTGSSTDEVYVPSLWYFNLLQFTSDQEEARAGISSLNSPPDSLTDESLMTEPPSPSNSSDAPSQKSTSTVRNKKETTTLAQKKAKFLDIASNELQNRYTSKEQAFGDSVAHDLEKMEELQGIIAKKLISEILFNGRMGLLNVGSSITVQPVVQPQNISSYSGPQPVPRFQPTAMQPPNIITLYPRNRQPYVNQGELSEQVSVPNLNIIDDVTINDIDNLNKYLKFNNNNNC